VLCLLFGIGIGMLMAMLFWRDDASHDALTDTLFAEQARIHPAAVGVLLPEWLRFAQAWYLFVFGSAVVLLMIWLPDGLLSIPDRLRAKKQARIDSAARSASAQEATNSGANA